jgi:hypothetical protein
VLTVRYKLSGGVVVIKIDFEQSHLFFPRIMLVICLLLLLAIAVKFLPNKIREYRGGKKISFFIKDYDKLRFYGSLGLIVIYFKSMEIVGGFFPNMGYGFLICSILFIFLVSLLFTGRTTRKKFIILSINSVVTPLTAWFVFGSLFNITLP